LLISFLAGLAVLGLALTFANLAAALPPVHDLERSFGPSGREAFRPVRFYDRDQGQLLFEWLHPSASSRRWIYLDPEGPIDLPSYSLQAILIAQDQGFWSHPGYLPAQALAAITDYLFGSQGDAANMTITERLAQAQLAPLYSGGENPGAARVQTVLLAAEITRRYPREQILEWYLNSADFGNQAYGIDAAALVYFDKHASDLTLAESTMLASIPLAPELNPVDQPDAATQIQTDVLEAMAAAGLISHLEARRASEAQLVFASPAEAAVTSLDSFEAYITQYIEGSFGRSLLGRSGLRVQTSLDLDLHRQALCTLESQVNRLNGGEPGAIISLADGSGCLAVGLLTPIRPKDAGVDHAIQSGAVVILDPQTGELLSLIGPGTSPKPATGLEAPFTALTAFAQGYTPASMLLDVPLQGSNPVSQLPGYGEHGPVRLRIALANQYQAALDRLIDQVGLESVRRTVASFGFQNQKPSLTGVEDGLDLDSNLLELVHAYSVFASEGQLHGTRGGIESLDGQLEPVVILQIEDGNQRLIYQADPGSQSLVSAQLAYLMVDILSDESARWPSVGKGSPLEVGRPAGVVASMSPETGQAWTLGFTPGVVIGVWFESQSPAAAETLTAMNGPAPVWHALLQYATRDHPPASWRIPPGVSSLEVCDPSGLLPTLYCPNVVREVFLNGTEPTTFDNLFQPFLVNRETGKLATLNTPPDLVEEQVFMVVPPEAAEWANEAGIARPPEEYDTLRAEEPDPQVNISAPESFTFLRGIVRITGHAEPEGMERFRVQYGRGLNPTSWVQIGQDENRPVRGGLLATWDTSALSGLYTIQLVVVDGTGRLRTDAVQVTVDNSAPAAVITLPEAGQLIVGDITESTVLQVDASDEYGVARVVFYVDGQVAATLTGESFSTTWRLSRSGEHTLYAEVFDLAGNATISPSILFVVTRPDS